MCIINLYPTFNGIISRQFVVVKEILRNFLWTSYLATCWRPGRSPLRHVNSMEKNLFIIVFRFIEIIDLALNAAAFQ